MKNTDIQTIMVIVKRVADTVIDIIDIKRSMDNKGSKEDDK